MDALDLIAATLELPHTHKVVTTYDDGSERVFTTRSLKSAENYAIGDKRRIGAPLIRRNTGKTVRIVSVDVQAVSA